MNSSRLRWLPAAVIPAAIVATAFTVPALADSPALPERSAQEVLELIAGSTDAAFSGTVQQDSDLGLPDLPDFGPGDGAGDEVSSALEALTGSHEARVFDGGPDTARIQVVDTLSERNVVRNGSSVWLYDSAENTAVHTTLPDVDPPTLPPLPAEADTPAELAERLLEAVEPSTTVTVGDTARVAGRAVYTLTLTPDSNITLIGSATLSVDAETGLPLAASVVSSSATDDSPAFSVEFTEIDFSTPDPELFEFTPPADATVTEKPVDDTGHGHGDTAVPGGDPSADPATSTTVVGTGWDTIVSVPVSQWFADAPSGDAAQGDSSPGDVGTGADPEASALLDQLTTTVDEGRLFETTLATVLVTNDGRVLVGAVPAEQLQAAAASAQ